LFREMPRKQLLNKRNHQEKLRSLKSSKKVNETLRQQTRLVHIFPNQKSCLRLCTGYYKKFTSVGLLDIGIFIFPEHDVLIDNIATENQESREPNTMIS